MMPDLSPEAKRIAQVIAAWNMKQMGIHETDHRLCQKGHLCVHQIRELAELVQAELAKKEETHDA